jgi:glutaredoxin-like YruB-family protein
LVTKRFPAGVPPITLGTFSAYNHTATGSIAKEDLRCPRRYYSASTCSWCRRAKRYFKERGVPFKEINIERDAAAARDIVRKTGQMGVPVIKIGSRWIVGFDKEQIDKELARKAS